VTHVIQCAVYGREDDFVLVSLPVTEVSRLGLEHAVINSLPYCGVLWFIDGDFQARCNPRWDATSTMMSAAPHFARYVHAKVGNEKMLTFCRTQKWSELS
jgi:hypothetical protein